MVHADFRSCYDCSCAYTVRTHSRIFTTFVSLFYFFNFKYERFSREKRILVFQSISYGQTGVVHFYENLNGK